MRRQFPSRTAHPMPPMHFPSADDRKHPPWRVQRYTPAASARRAHGRRRAAVPAHHWVRVGVCWHCRARTDLVVAEWTVLESVPHPCVRAGEMSPASVIRDSDRDDGFLRRGSIAVVIIRLARHGLQALLVSAYTWLEPYGTQFEWNTRAFPFEWINWPLCHAISCPAASSRLGPATGRPSRSDGRERRPAATTKRGLSIQLSTRGAFRPRLPAM